MGTPGRTPPDLPSVAFVLGGGGVLGAAEVGMLRALVEADVKPDVVLVAHTGLDHLAGPLDVWRELSDGQDPADAVVAGAGR